MTGETKELPIASDMLNEFKDADSFNYIFTALRGIQAGREFYVAMCPLKLIPKLFLFDERELPPRLRAQRTLNLTRIPSISRYIIENPRNYTFSSITASIDGRVEFKPLSTQGPASKVGYLVVPMSARLIINDGQHRRAAIEKALKIKPELGSETISVVLFVDTGLKRSQQMFADLNKYATRPTMSLGILYDYRDPMARLCIKLAEAVPVFLDRIELEKTTLSNRSAKLFTLSSLYQATKSLLGKTQKTASIAKQEEELATEYWKAVSDCMSEWKLLLVGETTPSELRKRYVHSHGIALLAMGVVGRSLLLQFPDRWREQLRGLERIDWSRTNTAMWEGRAMQAGRIVGYPNHVVLVANALKRELSIALTKQERELEDSISTRERETS